MTDPIWSIILYPALADPLSDAQQQFLTSLRQRMSNHNQEQLQEALSQRITLQEIRHQATAIPQAQRQHLYLLAEQVATLGGISELTATALAELHCALGVNGDTHPCSGTGSQGTQESIETHFAAIRSRYCRIATACSFIPLPFVSDAFVLVPIQARMVERIANLFEYPIYAKPFVKMIVDKAGPEYASAIAGRMAISLVPVLGWLASAAITYGLTYAVAQVARAYIERQGELSKEDIQRLYKEAYVHGKMEFECVKDTIRKDRDKLIERFKKLSEDRPLVQKFEQHFQYVKSHLKGTNGNSKGMAQ